MDTDANWTSTRTGETGGRVLYVASDARLDDGVVDRLRTRLAGNVSLTATVAAEASAAAETDRWACLVLDGVVDDSVFDSVRESVDCPIVLFTSADPSSVPARVLDHTETVVERGNGDRSVAFLAAKIGTLLRSHADAADHALSAALSTVAAETRDTTALFVLDDRDRVVWSTHDFETVFPTAATDATVPETADFYTRLDALSPTVPEGSGLLELDGGTDASDEHSVVVSTTGRSRFYVRESHDLSAVGAGLRLERFDDVTDRVRHEARSALLERLVEQAQDGLYTLDHNGVIDFCNESFAANLGYDRADLIGEHAAVTLAPGELETGQETVQYLLAHPEEESTEVDMTFRTRSGDHRTMSIHYTLLPTEDGTYGGLMGVVRDVTERDRREQQIERQRDELATLNRTNELVQEIIASIGDAANREELQHIVCDRLVEAGRYELAWIGERRRSSDIIVPLHSAGNATAYLDKIEVRTDDSPSGQGPGGRACRSGAVQVVSDISSDDRFSPWREHALAAGLESVAVVPLQHGETTHGILAVYASEPAAFSDRVTESFGVLGETIGLALTAIQNKRLLQRDATVTLTFRSESEDACLVWLANACDCTLETAGAVETEDGVVQYLRVEGATPDAVVDAVGEYDPDRRAAVTRTDGDQIVEIHTEGALSVALSEAGARLQTATARPDGVRVTVETSSDADIRAIQNVVERFNPEMDLVAKTEHSRPADDRCSDSPLDSLTDRQREVLRAAYLAGYYDWPRESTAEELAHSIEIASSTLHQHLRRAERNLFRELLDL